MALDGTKTIIAATGHYFVYADADTAAFSLATTKPTGLPEDGTAWTPTTGWVEFGHTSSDNPMTIGRDGGDTTTVGTWQAPNLETSVATVTYSIQFSLLQLDALSLSAYYGGGEPGDGTLAPATDWVIPSVPAAQETSLLVQIVHSTGTRAKWLYLPKVSLIGSDSAEAATDAFLGFPVTATVLDAGDTVLNGLFSVSGAVAA